MVFSMMIFSAILRISMIMVINFPSYSPLLLNSFASPFSLPSKDKNIGFSVSLIHSSSLESPFYDPTATPLGLMRASLRTSLARAAYLSWLSSNNFSSSMKYPVSPVDLMNKDYVMKFSIGTPPVEAFAIPDTGSSLIWLQCLYCKNCNNQSVLKPIFDPRKSSSYVPVKCGSEECNNMAYTTNCDASQQLCTYDLMYWDKNVHTRGSIGKETLIFRDTNEGIGPIPLLNTVFGCDLTNTFTGEDIPGVFGLSNYSSSLLGQQGFSEFSYCISSNVKSGHSQIRFGSSSVIPSGGLTTEFFPIKEGLYYFKKVDGIFIEGEKVDAPDLVFQYEEGGRGGLMIDTGTTYSVLNNLALAPLIKKLQEKMPPGMEEERDISDDKWDLCYNNKYRFTQVLPEIEFRFNGNGDSFPLSDQNAWVDNSHGQFCLAIRRSYDFDVSVLGIYQQRDVNVRIHQTGALVSFMYGFDCAAFN